MVVRAEKRFVLVLVLNHRRQQQPVNEILGDGILPSCRLLPTSQMIKRTSAGIRGQRTGLSPASRSAIETTGLSRFALSFSVVVSLYYTSIQSEFSRC
jgi:hypothetical protein